MIENAKRDENRVSTIIAVSEVDGVTPVRIHANPTTNALLVEDQSGGGVGDSGVQYTEGDTDTTITGTAIMWEDTSDTLKPVSATSPLPVSAASLPLPAGAATAANQQTDALTDTELRATPVPVSGTVTAELSATDNAVLDNISAAVNGTIIVDSELPAAAALGDSASNPTVPAVGSYMMATEGGGVWNRVLSLPSSSDNATAGDKSLLSNSRTYVFNGTGWDRVRGDTTNGMDVDVTRLPSLPAGTNAIGNAGIIPRTSGGLDIFRSIDLDETEEQVKATAGQLFSITAFNMGDSPLYLKLYNATAASVTVGTTTPVLTFVVPANADSDGAGFVWNNEIGLAFSIAITAAATTGVADTDTGAPGTNVCIVNIGYK